MKLPDEWFRRPRSLRELHNRRVLDAWIVESGDRASGKYYSLLKGKKAHLVVLQNGDIECAPSGRRRLGFWTGGFQHFSSIQMCLGEWSASELFTKYVRLPHYVYRNYGETEVIDFIPFDQPAYWRVIRNAAGTTSLRFRLSHREMWPSDRSPSTFSASEDSCGIAVASDAGETHIRLECDGFSFSLEEGTLAVQCEGENMAFCVGLNCRQPAPDLEGHTLYHARTGKSCILRTPDFRFDKLFFWAKHDMLEFYSETERGNGFFAGFPEFSWFFGRDGEWMCMAASLCGLESEAIEHLNLLSRYSSGGRMPHEIPLAGKWSGMRRQRNFRTAFMSADSTPLWIMAWEKVSRWTGSLPDERMLENAMRFCASCDRNGDGLMENDFAKGLIGWPESWAASRDGSCVDINAWYIEAMRAYMRITGRKPPGLDASIRQYSKFFLSGEITDSVWGKRRRSVRSAVQAVPAMYFNCRRAADIVRVLSGSDFMTGWGLRSMSSLDPMYDTEYHTGTVWPLMTGWFVLAAYRNGLAVEGFRALSTFPELAFSSPEPGRINEAYEAEKLNPSGQFAQGWSSSLFIQSVMEGLFGLGVDEHSGCLLSNPSLPDGWKYMSLLRVRCRGNYYNVGLDGVNAL